MMERNCEHSCQYKAECKGLNDRAATRRRKPSVMRCCSSLASKEFIQKVTEKGQNILEVGYGKNRGLVKNAHRKGLVWYGIEPSRRWAANEENHKYAGTADNIPFDEQYFDNVTAIQSMEHWESYQDSVEDGINEIHRVLKPGGTFFAMMPMGDHGSQVFMESDVEALKKLFKRKMWKSIRFVRWGPEACDAWQLAITVVKR